MLFEVTDLRSYAYVAASCRDAAKDLAATAIRTSPKNLIAAHMGVTEANKIKTDGRYTVWDRFVQFGGPTVICIRKTGE